MARHASNRERMQRMALEAQLTAAEKAAKKAEQAALGGAPKKSTTRKKAATAARPGLKLIWKVVDPESREVATFPFPQKDAAEAKAAELHAEKGREHRVVGVKVPLDEVV